MREDQASSTALGVSVIRTVHQMMDDLPHILEDQISPILLQDFTIDRIRKEPEKHKSLAARGLRSHVVLRSRYAEDELREATNLGIKQFISLGSGYDTFPYRQPHWANDIRILEIDHPETQQAKRAHFKAKGLQDPPNLEFLPLDLEKDDFFNRVGKTSLDLEQPVWISCLGVLAYLQKQTVHQIFKSVAKTRRGSGIVFAFAPETETTDKTVEGIASVAERAAELGEPWLTRFTVENLRSELQECGFTEVSFLEPKEAQSRYYKNRTDLPVPRKVRLCKAHV